MTVNKDLKIGGLLLAAGGSSRFGSPKQLAIYQGKTLIRRAAETLVSSGCHPNAVVLGAETGRSTSEIADLPLNICVNADWQLGMSSSIRSGLLELLNIEPDLDAVLISLCDQPHVTSEMLASFVSQFRASRSPIIAAQYGETVGVPALFSDALFDALLNLEGDKGARDLIRKCDDVFKISCESAVFDIDTPNDAQSCAIR